MTQTPLMTPHDGPLVRPHRGTMVLVMGILSLVVGCVGWIFGIIAVTMGSRDLREMDAGLMDPAGRGMTQAGRICGIVGIVLQGIALVMTLIWLVFAGIMISATAAGRPPMP